MAGKGKMLMTSFDKNSVTNNVVHKQDFG